MSTNLYTLLSALHTTDTKLWGKLSGLTNNISGAFNADYVTVGTANGLTSSAYQIGTTTSGSFGTANKLATEAGAKEYIDAKDAALEAKVSDAFGSNAFVTVGKADGITASTLKLGATNKDGFGAADELAVEAAVTGYVADEIQKLSDAQGEALTGVLSSQTIAVTDGTKNVTLAARYDGTTIGADANGLKSLLTLKKLDTPASGTFAATYELQDSAGVKIGDQINIVKDQFLKTASYDSTNEELVFTFTVPSGELETRVNAHDLVHELSGSNAIIVTDVKGGQSEISLKLDTSTFGNEDGDGKFLSITSNGLLLSGVQAAINTAVAGAQSAATDGLTALSAALDEYTSENAVKTKFAEVDTALTGLNTRLTTAEGNITTLSTNLGTVSSDLATVSGDLATVSGDLDTAKGKIEALEAKTSGTITSGHVVIGGASGQYVDGGKVLGGGSFAATPNADTLATEAGVSGFVADAISTANANAVSASATLTADKIVLGAGDKGVKESSYEIAASGLGDTNATDFVPTANAVAAYVTDGLDTLLGNIQTLQGQIGD